MNDPFGIAIKEFFEKGKAPQIHVNSNYTEDETIDPSYFFRNERELPPLERIALKNCKGKILDIGAAAGCHSLILQKKGYNVTALEKSELAAEVMKKQGIVKVVCADIFEYDEKQFNTILLLMNGTGIGGTIIGLKKLLSHLKSLLLEGGQILIDSSDIKYLFEEEDGSQWVDLANTNYYGEMQYEVSFRKSTDKFDWLFIDSEKLQLLANELGYSFTLIKQGNHYDYLAKLSI
ncbi:class I SAM-dependent methyltransferase [Draconibacterium sp. IB214405]|uniref:class I SAM-dependent methyltransferase n=1 Tax=Draconibacterium sp. IB214405 TaxID=3097352 RepID=UPI002A107724|nr:class I SAM-dependent methyltransferase [Draconibacterium sp. IB214405]MDX8339336.1 class I SAM-dependent methyltransferase [Draconibacterium sp. IB214405]